MERNCLDSFIKASEEARDLWVPSNIHTISGYITPLNFYREYVARNVPVLIKRGCMHWEAINKWTNEYLEETIRAPVTVAVTPDGHGDCIIEDKFVLPHEAQLTMDDFFNRLNSNPVYYIQKQCSSMDLEFSALKSDVPEMQWAHEAFGMGPDATNIWIGDSRAVSSTHKDPYENIYCVVAGSKEFTLLPPTDLAYLYRKRFPIAQFTKHFDVSLLLLH